MIYHVLTKDEWESRRQGTVVASPGAEGYVHCCDEGQLLAVRTAYFPADVLVVALSIDPTRLDAETRYEPGACGEPERFAHVYGPLRPFDVLGVVET